MSVVSTRILSSSLAAAVMLGCGSGTAELDPARPTGGPTIVLLTVDTLRADRLGCYGRDRAGTSHWDGIAERGVRFTSAQTVAPLTLPAHSSLLTGRSLPAHGVFNNGTFALPRSVPTLAEALSGAGYATAAFLSSTVLAERYGLGRGFELYDDAVPPRHMARVLLEYPERPGTETVRRALEWLSRLGDRPAFLWVHLWEPHIPYSPPAPYARAFASDLYQGEVAAADAALGELLEGLRTLGRRDGLLLAATSDHGEALGDHGEETHGLFVYRPVLRVPLVVTGPSWGIESGLAETPVSLADVAPTLLDLAGLPPLPGADGLSLAALLRGGSALPARRGVFAESHVPRIEFDWSGLRALVTDRYKLIDAPRPELYDRREDPGEKKDLAESRPEVVRDLQGALAELLRSAGAEAPGQAAERRASAEELAALRALGYVASGRSLSGMPLVDRERPDLKDRIGLTRANDRAMTLAARGGLDEALAILRSLEDEEPGNPVVLTNLGSVLLVSGRVEEAREKYESLVELHPDFATAWFQLGKIQDLLEERETAEASYRRAIAADPLNVLPRMALAGLLADMGRIDEAIEALEEARALDPENRGIRADLERFRARDRAPASR